MNSEASARWERWQFRGAGVGVRECGERRVGAGGGLDAGVALRTVEAGRGQVGSPCGGPMGEGGAAGHRCPGPPRP